MEEEVSQSQTLQSQQAKWYTPLTRVTPLSHALTLTLLVVLPVVGFWMGVGYGQLRENDATENVKNVVTEEGVTSPNNVEMLTASTTLLDTKEQVPRMNLDESWTYTNDRLGFTIQVPNVVESDLIIEDIETNTITFRTNVTKDTYTPQEVFTIAASLSGDFHRDSFLEKVESHYWARDVEYPFDPTSARYSGESDVYVFYFMKGNDCYPGHHCDVYAMSDSILETFAVSHATLGTVSQPSDQAKVWREYYDGRSSLAFWYPTEWGDVKVEDVSFRPEEAKDDTTGQFDGIDLSRVQTEGYGFSFTNAQCDFADFCLIGYQIRYFSSQKPVELVCYETQCKTLNLADDREFVEKNYSFENNGNKWLCEEGYYKPGGTVYKKCRAYHGNIKSELQMGYGVKDFETLRQLQNNKEVTLDDAVGKVSNDVDYSAFRTKYEKLLKTTLLNL